MIDEQLFDGEPRYRATRRSLFGNTQRIESIITLVGHGGINRTKPVFAVQPLNDEREAGIDRALAQSLRPDRICDQFEQPVDRAEKCRPIPVLVRRALRDVRALGREQFRHMDATGIARQRLQRLQALSAAARSPVRAQ